MLRTLRSKLILSHVLVVLFAFALTAILATIPIQRAQEREVNRDLRANAEALARQLDLGIQLGRTFDPEGSDSVLNLAQVAQFALANEQERSGNRVLFVSRSGEVLFDSASDGSFAGEHFPEIERAINALVDGAAVSDVSDGVAERLALSQQSLSRRLPEISGYNAAIATTRGAAVDPDQTLFPVTLASERNVPVVDQVVQPVLIAGGVALVVGIGLSFFHARSLSRPISHLTDAAGEINAGNLDRRVSTGGAEEVDTLVDAFNGMLDRLADTYSSQRQLLANIAHELRTPLTTIQGYAQALRDGVVPPGDAQDEALLAITEEAERMGKLVNQILQLSRLESGELPLRREEVPLDELFEQLAREFAPRSAEAGVDLRILPPGLLVVGDAELLRQAVGNLVGNAIRHTPEDGEVTVRAAETDGPAGVPVVHILVEDTGEGIAYDDLQHIFERFYRAGVQEQSGTQPSFGLGLAIVREVIHRHGGRVGVTSAPGMGTTFTIELPAEAVNG